MEAAAISFATFAVLRQKSLDLAMFNGVITGSARKHFRSVNHVGGQPTQIAVCPPCDVPQCTVFRQSHEALNGAGDQWHEERHAALTDQIAEERRCDLIPICVDHDGS